jgi:integrase
VSTTVARLPHSSELRRAGLASRTYDAYHKAVDTFLSTFEITFADLRRMRTVEIDLRLAAWLEAEFESGGSRQYGENTRSGLHFFLPRVKNRLHESHLRLKGWKKCVPGKSYLPMPKNIATLVAVHLAAADNYLAGLAVLLSFDCYLRVNECVNLLVGDVRIPADGRMGERYLHCAVHLRKTKTLNNLSCTIRDPVIARLLHRCVIGRSKHERLFPFTAGVFRSRLFKPTVASLGLAQMGFVPHSLRHGGATHDYVIAGRSETEVVNRGRWASTASADRYMQTLAAVDLTYQVPRSLDSDGRDYWSCLEAIFDQQIGDDLPRLPPLSHTETGAR